MYLKSPLEPVQWVQCVLVCLSMLTAVFRSYVDSLLYVRATSQARLRGYIYSICISSVLYWDIYPPQVKPVSTCDWRVPVLPSSVVKVSSVGTPCGGTWALPHVFHRTLVTSSNTNPTDLRRVFELDIYKSIKMARETFFASVFVAVHGRRKVLWQEPLKTRWRWDGPFHRLNLNANK